MNEVVYVCGLFPVARVTLLATEIAVSSLDSASIYPATGELHQAGEENN